MSFVLGTFGAFVISSIGGRLKLIDRPNERSSHIKLIPKGGGIGILAAFCLTAAYYSVPLLIWVPAAFISLISLIGDRFDLSVGLRLGLQFIAAGVACWGIGTLSNGLIRWQTLGLPLGFFASVFFVVATANIYNFMDGINGIAGITTVIAFCLLAITGWIRGETPSIVMIAGTMAAATMGFLPWNFPKARVFMGDGGSILLGFTYALITAAWSHSPADFLMFISFLLPFFVDEGVTLIARLRSRDSLTQPHRRHIYQILVNQMGVPHWKISSLYGIIQVTVSGVAILLYPLGWIILTGWLLLVMTGMGIAGVLVRRYE